MENTTEHNKNLKRAEQLMDKEEISKLTKEEHKELNHLVTIIDSVEGKVKIFAV